MRKDRGTDRRKPVIAGYRKVTIGKPDEWIDERHLEFIMVVGRHDDDPAPAAPSQASPKAGPRYRMGMPEKNIVWSGRNRMEIGPVMKPDVVTLTEPQGQVSAYGIGA